MGSDRTTACCERNKIPEKISENSDIAFASCDLKMFYLNVYLIVL